MYIKQLRHSKNEIANTQKHICRETMLFGRGKKWWIYRFFWNWIKFYLIHLQLSTITFNFCSISYMILINRTFRSCISVDVMTRKQNSLNPEHLLYELISWRTKFFTQSALMSRSTMHKWKLVYPIAWHILLLCYHIWMVAKVLTEMSSLHRIYKMYNGNNARSNFIVLVLIGNYSAGMKMNWWQAVHLTNIYY